MEIIPQAAVIPKDTDRLPKGKYGPIFPRSPACYGFTIIANVKPGTAETIRDHGVKLVKALESDPHLLAPISIVVAGLQESRPSIFTCICRITR
jgi:hypothetical protein